MEDIPQMTWAALAVAVGAGEFSEPVPIVIVVGDRADAADVALARSAPIITATLGNREVGHRNEPSDLVTSDEELESIVHAVAANPHASTSLALLLRASEGLPLVDAIQMESLAYAALQGSSEFDTWLSSRPKSEPLDLSDDSLIVRQNREVTTLVLNRPDSANALNRSLRHDLTQALTALSFTSGPIVVQGAGKHFSSGGDLREFGMAKSPASAHLDRMRANLPLAFARVAGRMTAHVHGACVGAGLELSSFAANVTAAPNTRWRLPEVSMGLIPGCGGTVSVTRRIGRHRTLSLALTGEEIDARRALEWGLVDQIVDQ